MFRGRVPGRAVIQMVGRDARTFLHGLFTSNVKELAPGTVQHGCFLNRQGRVLFDGMIASYGTAPPPALQPTTGPLKEGEELFVVDVDRRVADDVMEHFDDFKLRAKFKAYDASDLVAPIVGSRAACAMKDPREPLSSSLTREYVDKATADALPDCNDQYLDALCENGLAEGTDVFISGKTLPFHANIDITGGVSFHKGCYLGQELTHRTHVMLVTRKRTVPIVSNFEELPLKVGTSVYSSKSGEGPKSIGSIVAVAGRKATAMIRLEPFREVFNKPAAERHVQLMVHWPNTDGTESLRLASVTARIPEWWPQAELDKVFVEKDASDGATE